MILLVAAAASLGHAQADQTAPSAEEVLTRFRTLQWRPPEARRIVIEVTGVLSAPLLTCRYEGTLQVVEQEVSVDFKTAGWLCGMIQRRIEPALPALARLLFPEFQDAYFPRYRWQVTGRTATDSQTVYALVGDARDPEENQYHTEAWAVWETGLMSRVVLHYRRSGTGPVVADVGYRQEDGYWRFDRWNLSSTVMGRPARLDVTFHRYSFGL
ncbi:MAG: hypothetical protein HY660_18905 [Armatimonadetes bacterium]|nr:hypothetical protein [Armatimonadota bacterium]